MHENSDNESENSSTVCMSEDTTQALIESMEHQIEQLKDEVLKLKLKIQTFQNIIKSDILDNIFSLLYNICVYNMKSDLDTICISCYWCLLLFFLIIKIITIITKLKS